MDPKVEYDCLDTVSRVRAGLREVQLYRFKNTPCIYILSSGFGGSVPDARQLHQRRRDAHHRAGGKHQTEKDAKG